LCNNHSLGRWKSLSCRLNERLRNSDREHILFISVSFIWPAYTKRIALSGPELARMTENGPAKQSAWSIQAIRLETLVTQTWDARFSKTGNQKRGPVTGQLSL
jgi:hypothetical protein